MALIITPGPAPEDNTRLKLEDDLGNFVRGTTISNFGPEQFAGAPINFVTATTDPPATDIRTQGSLWFARGVGRMYKWTKVPVQDELWAPSEAGTNLSEFVWVAISERKETLARCRYTWGANEKLRVSGAVSEWKIQPHVGAASEPRYVPVMSATAGTSGSELGQGFGFNDAIFFGQHNHIDPTYISLSGASDGDYQVVVDCGFVDAKISGEGANGVNAQLAWHFGDQDPHYRGWSCGATCWTNTAAIWGIIAESAASQAEHVLNIFMLPGSSNMAKQTGSALFSNSN